MSLVGDAEIRALNRAYLGRDRATNVLAFPQEGALLGDVVISTETAVRQAARSGYSPEEEVAYLLIHGILHLLGHDHERDRRGARAMRALQNRLFAAHGGLLLPREDEG